MVAHRGSLDKSDAEGRDGRIKGDEVSEVVPVAWVLYPCDLNRAGHIYSIERPSFLASTIQ